MKSLKKLALATAVALTSVSAFALEAADDEVLASTTGQDGITIKVILPDFTPTAATAGYGAGATIQALQTAGATNSGGTITSGYKGISVNEVRVHDDDGIATATDSGALVIGGNGAGDKTEVYTNQASPLVIDIDSVGGATPMLNVKITTPTLQIKTGAIYVADSNADTAALGGAHVDTDGSTIANKSSAIMTGMTLTLGVTTLNIQLGAAETQGHQIAIDTVMTGGISIDNFSLNDNAGAIKGGSINVGSLKIVDAGGANLTVKAYVDVGSRNAALGAALQDITNGLVLTVGQLGDATNGVDMTMNNVKLGDSNITADLGDVQMLGVNLNGSELVIVGH